MKLYSNFRSSLSCFYSESFLFYFGEEMNITNSLEVRYRDFKRLHLSLFSEGRELKQLKEIHSGKRCFIIGNGPSLKAEDLTRLSEAGEITFAFNRIFHIFEDTPWRPTYYISQDEKMLAGSIAEVNAIEVTRKFIPIEMHYYYGIDLEGITPFHISSKNEVSTPGFSEDVVKCVENSMTVVYTAIQFAVYMGIKEIYLIGVDHHFHTSINAQGEIVVDPTAKDYFSDVYNEDKKDLYIPNTDLSTLTFIAAKKYADAHGIKIYNATRGGKLEVFERKDFDSLFCS